MNLLWLAFMLLQPGWRYHILGFHFFVSTVDQLPSRFPEVLNVICDHPLTSSIYLCHMATSHSQDAVDRACCVDARFRALGELSFASSLSTGLEDAQLSIDDAVFLVKVSKADCHPQMDSVNDGNRLGCISFTGRAEALNAADL